MRTTDYIIIGQGLCGTWLSYYLQKLGASVLVIDKGISASASYAASGIINPITGKRLARQWMGDTMLPFARDAYAELGKYMGQQLAREIPIHTFFSTQEEATFFEQKATAAEDDLLSTGGHQEHFNYHYGIGTIYPSTLVEVRLMLEAWRTTLARENTFIEEEWNWEQCIINNEGVQYNNIVAKAVIDCSGSTASDSPYFSRLPFALNKGEAIITGIPGLPSNAIYKYANLSIVPWKDDLFWIGSTFDWDYKDDLPTAVFRAKAEAILRQWLKLPFTFQEHFAAIRPATVTRDAFAGLHPQSSRVGILDGTGSKGCSLAPFLASDLAEHLVKGRPLIPQVDISRYAKVLGR